MAKFKLSLKALPDFKLPVKFQMANGEDATVVLTVKHKKSSELQEILDQEKLSTDELVKAICSDWDLEEEFNDENVKEFASLFPGAVPVLMEEYMRALAGQRAKS